MAEDKKVIRKPHNLILENRKMLSISGVEDVDSFDEQSVVLFTDMGMLTIKGSNLHINRLNVENGEISLEGDIDIIGYADETVKKGGGMFSRLFK